MKRNILFGMALFFVPVVWAAMNLSGYRTKISWVYNNLLKHHKSGASYGHFD